VVHHLFVYGTLLQGQPSDGLLAGLPSQPATLRGYLYRMKRGYPALVPDPDGLAIQGELVEISDVGRFAVIDIYEGVPQGLYTRIEHPVELAIGRGQLAWVYVITRQQAILDDLRPLRVTDWRQIAPRGIL
jgi:gamma-glutamylcyclotransferase (GGCT)/AIG2-like uncharacterized protein YtfP